MINPFKPLTAEDAVLFCKHLLRYSFVPFLFVIGGDKVLHTDFLAQWEEYVGPFARAVYLHRVSPHAIVTIQGIIEVSLGLLMLFTPFVRTVTVLFIIAILLVLYDLFALHHVIVATRDVMIIVSGIVLIILRSVQLKPEQAASMP